MTLTAEQREFLEWLRPDGNWRVVSIDRSGRKLGMAKVRQQCRLKGLAESHDFHRRTWRITDAGRAALEQGQ